MIVYFSSVSGYTHRFVEKLGIPARRIPIRPRVEGMLRITEPSVLIVPTYGAGPATKAVPKQVIEFLNIKENRDLVIGVIGAGNTNFGEAFGIAGDIISNKLQIPLLYRFEIFGTPEDVETVQQGIPEFVERRIAELGLVPPYATAE
ncbi:class Ib ribonucleoside-diphosphate reductase assembly flavoprotein NrdI [Leucobacter sp. cx-328]|uniref:class Ib ribonucleoside-diphosphate reductase assembly flavoprotein NrdI n=1 Tax=unclassified Leucobacter TaxID=2621730 RepID=UPI00165D415D|nr:MULTISPECIES: class Ib ribonucleoside-diphosphate reductase assembly flavoprotein NrdI [unclassified Leucobacter]MBC9943048.1 class Ib ribonucleoside-diphosphate reductase assembly flavoprotein NrdI [Leucobacter sp. cx-328]